jgi:hypothetical protein
MEMYTEAQIQKNQGFIYIDKFMIISNFSQISRKAL